MNRETRRSDLPAVSCRSVPRTLVRGARSKSWLGDYPSDEEQVVTVALSPLLAGVGEDVCLGLVEGTALLSGAHRDARWQRPPIALPPSSCAVGPP